MTEEFQEKRKAEIAENKILIYGKGRKGMPMCGFTGKVMGIFEELGKPYHVVNILDDAELRAEMKEFSGWPTFPQIYINGEFIGGCDIACELYESGELQKLVDGTSVSA